MTIKENLTLNLNSNKDIENISIKSDAQYLNVFDRLYIKEYVVKASVGIHADEKKAHQRMRFSIEAYILKKQYNDENIITDVVDYDFLIKSIHKVIDDRHNNLVEVIAENIAKDCLKDKRIKQINITVEKLDRLDSGILGYQITRSQKSKTDNIYPINDSKLAAE